MGKAAMMGEVVATVVKDARIKEEETVVSNLR